MCLLHTDGGDCQCEVDDCDWWGSWFGATCTTMEYYFGYDCTGCVCGEWYSDDCYDCDGNDCTSNQNLIGDGDCDSNFNCYAFDFGE